MVLMLCGGALAQQKQQQKQPATRRTQSTAESAGHAYFRKAAEELMPKYAEARARLLARLEDDDCKGYVEFIVDKSPLDLKGTMPLLGTALSDCGEHVIIEWKFFRMIVSICVGVLDNLPLVDHCNAVYRATIDRRAVDRTERESEAVAACKARGLYVADVTKLDYSAWGDQYD